MRVSQAFPIALLLALFAAGPAGIARGSVSHNDREPRIRDDHTSRDAIRDQRDAERREQDMRDRELKDAQDLAERQAKDAADAVKDGNDTSGSNSGSSGSGSGSSGSGSDDDSSGSSSSNSGSGSDDDDADDDDDSGGDAIAGSDSGRIDVESDQEGRERRKGELLVRGDSILAESLRTAGFVRLSIRHLANLDQSVIRVRVRDGSTFDADIAFLRAFQGAIDAEPNYVFRLSGGAATAPTAAKMPPPAAVDAGSGIHVGVIDTGADSAAPGLGERVGSSRAFGGRYTPRAHGTHVAQILVRQGVRVDIADVFQTDASGAPLATAESIARGIDWMASRGVPVINVSITGPRSALLSEVVARAIARGSIIIAAAGNDGPAAPPVYPAAFPEVVGVTAVDADGRIYRRANRGDHVDFAAFGVRVPVDAGGGRVEYISGTSYAAPLVAAAVARRYRAPRPGDSISEVGALRGLAIDMGDRGRDPIFGWGLVAPPSP
jgi:hypothetical protein